MTDKDRTPESIARLTPEERNRLLGDPLYTQDKMDDFLRKQGLTPPDTTGTSIPTPRHPHSSIIPSDQFREGQEVPATSDRTFKPLDPSTLPAAKATLPNRK